MTVQWEKRLPARSTKSLRRLGSVGVGWSSDTKQVCAYKMGIDKEGVLGLCGPMNELDQRMAIAQAEGWKNVAPSGYPPQFALDGYLEIRDLPPDYLTDLNAMHHAEKVLTEEQINEYGAHLKGRDGETVSLYSPEHREIAKVAMASAAQRAESFLKTIGKWKE